MKTNKEVQKWYCLDNNGNIRYVGDFSSFDEADDAIGTTAIWLVTEDVARQWLADLKSMLETKAQELDKH